MSTVKLARPAGSMTANVVPNSIPAFHEDEVMIAYNKIISIRDDVVANKASAIKQLNLSATSANTQSPAGPSPPIAGPTHRLPNGTSKLMQTSTIDPNQPSTLHVPKTRSNPFQPKSPNAQKVPAPSPAPSGIDPIFLTKSDVLVRAEIHQKRQRIERALEEQVHRSQKQKGNDQDALPEFDVTEVLRKAQELVKPVNARKDDQANGGASPSDSFDENTFYSSQMEESTTTEDVDESTNRRPRPMCNFFLRGETCRFGATCTFSHDPIQKQQRLEADGLKAINRDRINADEETSARSNNTSNKRIRTNTAQHKAVTKGGNAENGAPPTQAELERQERIARLEAELESAKAEIGGVKGKKQSGPAKTASKPQEGPLYSPVGADEFGRDIGLREPESRRPMAGSQRRGGDMVPSNREYGRSYEKPASPSSDDVRVVTNHIRSPVAPQPSRVSPLAFAKVPQVSQVQREHGENRRSSGASNLEIPSGRQSPNVNSQPRNARKRRRGRESGEQLRNVAPRTDLASPAIRVKEEPISSPPFGATTTELRQVRVRQEAPQQVYVDTDSPRYRPEEPAYYQPRVVERPAHGFGDDGRGPQTPIARRIISRNGQHYVANEEQDLRRVVTAPREVRAPISPAPFPAQNSAPQPRATRAASQVYLSPTGQGLPQHYRASVQPPQPATYAPNDRSPSPSLRRLPQSPTESYPYAMAPPPRRIVVDQWGNRFMEAPMPVERHVSVATVPRGSDATICYESAIPRSASVMRQPQIVRLNDDGRRAQSPSVNGFYDPSTRQFPDPRSKPHQDEPYIVRENGSRFAEPSGTYSNALYEQAPVQDTRTTRIESVRPLERHYEEPQARDERIVRMSSVRPVTRHFEAPQERIQRVQSVLPEQPRIIRLGEKQEPFRQSSRQLSVMPDHGGLGGLPPTAYAVEERPRYQYAPQVHNGGYVQEIQDDGGLYETPHSGGRRIVQRM